jgi:hypothetical protein
MDWISVKDKLPEFETRVLVLGHSGDISIRYRPTPVKGYGSQDGDVWYPGGWGIGWATHWMPLPPPPHNPEVQATYRDGAVNEQEIAMEAKRYNGGYIFHGGCNGCTNHISICPGCMYMEPNWDLPDLNPVNIKKDKERQAMKALAYSLANR